MRRPARDVDLVARAQLALVLFDVHPQGAAGHVLRPAPDPAAPVAALPQVGQALDDAVDPPGVDRGPFGEQAPLGPGGDLGDEVAGALQVNVETVRRWIRSGDLSAVLLGGARTGYRIHTPDLQRFTEQRLTG